MAGRPLIPREPKVPYNGAVGVPIREEILARYGAAVITRNSHGARCLNTPDILFADVDATAGMPPWIMAAAGLVSMTYGGYVRWRGESMGAAVLTWVLCAMAVAIAVHILHRAVTGGLERRIGAARRAIRW
jgi:hypothetical protein